jgi:hypothetical protein
MKGTISPRNRGLVAAAAVSAATGMAAPFSATSAVAQARKVPTVGFMAGMTFKGSWRLASRKAARIGSPLLLEELGPATFLAFHAEPQNQHRAQGDRDKGDDFKGSFHLLRLEEMFAQSGHGGECQSWKQISISI